MQTKVTRPAFFLWHKIETHLFPGQEQYLEGVKSISNKESLKPALNCQLLIKTVTNGAYIINSYRHIKVMYVDSVSIKGRSVAAKIPW